MSELRQISEQELKDILDKHGKWLRNENGGERANLSFANLSSANLRYANLSFANLRYADLSSANLRSADLSSANLVLFQFQRHQAFYTLDGTLRIGCLVMPVTEWLIGFEEIGKKEGYNEQQIKAYGNFIKMCSELLNEQT